MHAKDKQHTLNDIQEALLAQAACMVLNKQIDIPLIQTLFNELLDYQVYTDEMIEILYPKNDYTQAEFYVFFRTALQSIDYPLPQNEQQARELIIHYYLKRIAEQNYNPVNEISVMLDIIADSEELEDTTILGAAEPLYKVFISYDYSDYPDGANDNLYYSAYSHASFLEIIDRWAKNKAHLAEIAKKCLENELKNNKIH